MTQLFHKPPLEPGEPYPVFVRVSLETHSRCNRKCWFCPVATGRRDFPIVRLPDEAIERVLTEMGHLGFRGALQLFELNEPLLDKRMTSWIIRYARKAVPKATLYISTNADTISNVDDIKHLFDEGLNALNLNIYDTGEEGVEQAKRLNILAEEAVALGHCSWTDRGKYQPRPVSSRHIYVTDMRIERDEKQARSFDKFFDKIGEKRTQVGSSSPCARPHRHLVILHNGDVPLCCQGDPTDGSLPVIGNVKERSLWSIWQDPAWRPYRYHLAHGRRSILPACANCRATTAYSHNVRRLSPANVRETV